MNNEEQQRTIGAQKPESGSTVPVTLEEVLRVASETTTIRRSGSTVLVAPGEAK